MGAIRCHRITCIGRSNWALVDKGKKKTVILFHHHDTVDLEDYGNLAEIALDSDKVAEALKRLDSRPDMQEDLASGEWKFGRGSCDMKAALALQLGVLEAYAADPVEGQVNLLYLSVGDEESYSRDAWSFGPPHRFAGEV